MIKIIEGRKYDTETACLLGEYSENQYGDVYYLYESLYKKKNGEYFLNVVGGAWSVYGIQTERYCCGSEDIIKISENEAKQWAEKHISGESYIEAFGDVDE